MVLMFYLFALKCILKGTLLQKFSFHVISWSERLCVVILKLWSKRFCIFFLFVIFPLDIWKCSVWPEHYLNQELVWVVASRVPGNAAFAATYWKRQYVGVNLCLQFRMTTHFRKFHMWSPLRVFWGDSLHVFFFFLTWLCNVVSFLVS